MLEFSSTVLQPAASPYGTVASFDRCCITVLIAATLSVLTMTVWTCVLMLMVSIEYLLRSHVAPIFFKMMSCSFS